MLVGFIMLITEGQKAQRHQQRLQQAFYGAEAGMEKAELLIWATSLTKRIAVNDPVERYFPIFPMPPTINGVQYTKFDGTTGYSLTYPTMVQGILSRTG